MPNHIDNDLIVSGDFKELKKFKEFSKEGDKLLSANKFIPYPKEFKEQDEKARKQEEFRSKLRNSLKKKKLLEEEINKEVEKQYPYMKDGYNSGGYDWCCTNWGTKWGIYDVTLVSQTKNKMRYNFFSAWSPAIPVIKKMGEIFPTLKFNLKFYEGGNGFKGYIRIKKGEIIAEGDSAYSGHRGG